MVEGDMGEIYRRVDGGGLSSARLTFRGCGTRLGKSLTSLPRWTFPLDSLMNHYDFETLLLLGATWVLDSMSHEQAIVVAL